MGPDRTWADPSRWIRCNMVVADVIILFESHIIIFSIYWDLFLHGTGGYWQNTRELAWTDWKNLCDAVSRYKHIEICYSPILMSRPAVGVSHTRNRSQPIPPVLLLTGVDVPTTIVWRHWGTSAKSPDSIRSFIEGKLNKVHSTAWTTLSTQHLLPPAVDTIRRYCRNTSNFVYQVPEIGNSCSLTRSGRFWELFSVVGCKYR